MGFKSWFNGRNSRRELKKIQPLVNKVLELEEKYQKYSDEELRSETARFKAMFEGIDDKKKKDIILLVQLVIFSLYLQLLILQL